MTKCNDSPRRCKDCCSWVRLSDQDGGLGICDSLKSDHNQHVLGHGHPACGAFLDPGDTEWLARATEEYAQSERELCDRRASDGN